MVLSELFQTNHVVMVLSELPSDKWCCDGVIWAASRTNEIVWYSVTLSCSLMLPVPLYMLWYAVFAFFQILYVADFYINNITSSLFSSLDALPSEVGVFWFSTDLGARYSPPGQLVTLNSAIALDSLLAFPARVHQIGNTFIMDLTVRNDFIF